MTESDEHLMRRVARGDQAAFRALLERWEGAAKRYAFRMFGDYHAAEDAAQEAFVVAWRKLPGFRGQSQFRTWLLTIVWRKALDRRRRRARWWPSASAKHAHAGEAPADPLDNLAAGSADPETRAILSDAARRVRDEIVRLSPKLRDTLLLAASGEYSYDEIASLLGIPLGTVKWRVAEARRVLAGRCGGPTR